ncbi:YceI family protein [Mucilaginibacter sp. AW1-3]
MKRISLIILLLGATLLANAQTKHTVTKSSVTYQIKNMGFTTNGKFGGVEATILFDKAQLATSSIEASVAVKTINSDDDMRDEHLRKEGFFDADHYPKITLKSVSFKQTGSNNYTGDFDLTIKGKTKRIQLPFTYVPKGNIATFTGSFKLNRLDFGVGDTSVVLSNEVTVFLNVETSF